MLKNHTQQSLGITSLFLHMLRPYPNPWVSKSGSHVAKATESVIVSSGRAT